MPYIIVTDESRRAVATLNEARAACMRTVPNIAGPEWAAWVHVMRGLPESGGTLGALPDGTTITVLPVTWADLAESHPVHRASLIDAYNARHNVLDTPNRT